MNSEIIFICVCLLALGCVRESFQAKNADQLDDSIELSALKQVCSNPHGGRLNEKLIISNYQRFQETFSDSDPLRELIGNELSEFKKEFDALSKNRRTRNSSPADRVLEKYTALLCLMLKTVTEVVSDVQEA